MAKLPVFRGDPKQPLWIDDGGNMRPAWADDPCECCGYANCTDCEAATTGLELEINWFSNAVGESGGSHAECDANALLCDMENLNGTYILDKTVIGLDTFFRVELGTQGDCGDRGVLVYRILEDVTYDTPIEQCCEDTEEAAYCYRIDAELTCNDTGFTTAGTCTSCLTITFYYQLFHLKWVEGNEDCVTGCEAGDTFSITYSGSLETESYSDEQMCAGDTISFTVLFYEGELCATDPTDGTGSFRRLF